MNSACNPPLLLHASCVAKDGQAVLLLGPSGVGKSDLALRLIDRGYRLVADDLVSVFAEQGYAVARFPCASLQDLRGVIEARGVGLASVPWVEEARIALVVDLTAGEGERYPDQRTTHQAGVEIPFARLDAFHASTPIKIDLILCAAVLPFPTPDSVLSRKEDG